MKERHGNINVQDLEGDTPLHMCELVDVAREMIENLGADVTIENDEGLTAAEVIREDGDFDELADYLEFVTPGVAPVNIDTSALAYTEFREGDDNEGEEPVEPAIPAEEARRINEILRLEEGDGVNRDEELRNIVTGAIMRQLGRGGNEGAERNNIRRQRRNGDV